LPKGQNAFVALGAAGSLNWRTHLLFAIPALLASVTFDYFRLGGSLASWILLGITGVLVTVVSIELLSQLASKPNWQKPRPFVVVGILVVAGLIRGASFLILSPLVGIESTGETVFRLVGGPIFVLSIYAVFNSIVSTYLDHRQLSTELEIERYNLEQSRLDFETQLARLKDAQLAKVRELLRPALWELEKLLGDASLSKDAGTAVRALRQLNEDLVRPLSKTLTSQMELPRLNRFQPRSVKVGQFALPERMAMSQVFSLATFVPFVAIIFYSGTNAERGPVMALFVSLIVTSFVSIQFALWRRVFAGRTLKSVWALLISLIAGIQMGLSTWLMLQVPSLELSDQNVPQASGFLSQTMLGLFFLAVVQQQRSKSLSDLEAVVEDLRLLTSRLRQQVWLSQRNLATELHGSVQATLSSSALRLANLTSPTAEDLDRVRADVTAAIAKLGDEDYLAGKTFEDLLEEICELWEGSCEINYRLSEELSEQLSQDSGVAYCTLEVIREAVNNSIKHGQATQVDIDIKLGEDLIELEVSNNGQAPEAKAAGVGSELLTELSHSWELCRLDERTRLLATIPLASNAQLAH
jgi:signal transduction histidine kinase